MSNKHTKRKQTLSTGKAIRSCRKIHRLLAAYLFLVFLSVSITGLLLGWKKHSGGIILATSYQGTSTDLKDWLPLDSLRKNACKIVQDSVSADLSLVLERIDVRNDKGMVKFVFKKHFWAIQLDGATGKLLHIERRNGDLIEKMHDGSIFDFYAGTNGVFKLVFMSIIGLSLLLFTITGFWLWYGPRRLRGLKRKRTQQIPLRKPNLQKGDR